MTIEPLKTDLDSYERAIVEALHKNHHIDDSLEKFLEYRGVMRNLDRFESPEEKADILAKMINKGTKPDEWLRHIKRLHRSKINLHFENSPLLSDLFHDLQTYVEEELRQDEKKLKKKRTSSHGDFLQPSARGIAGSRLTKATASRAMAVRFAVATPKSGSSKGRAKLVPQPRKTSNKGKKA